jgi:S-DNA-T family DNA segregation ATPase FtsK/SpoIIIE
MPPTTNRLKNETAEKPLNTVEKKTKKEKSSRNFNNPLRSLLNNERLVKVLGLFFLLFSIFLVFSFTSHLFNNEADFDKVKDAPFWQYLNDSNISVQNSMGKIGALLAYVFFYSWFGVAAYLIPFCLFIVAFKMFFELNLLPISKTLGYSLFSLIFISLSCTFFLKDSNLIWGGQFGFLLNNYLTSIIGSAGVIFVLIFSAVTFLMLAFSFNFRLPQKMETALSQTNNIKNQSKGNQVKNVPPIAPFVNQEVELDHSITDETANDSEINEDAFDFEIRTEPEEPFVPETNDLTLDINEPIDEPEVIGNFKTFEEEPLALSEEDKERMNLKEILSENQEFDLGEYDPTLDLSTYKYPELDLLENHSTGKPQVDKVELKANSDRIIETLKNYGIEIAKISASIGPTVTLYEIIPAAGVRISKIKNLEDDIALSLSALGIRIIAPMPGKGTIGIEVPNQHPEIVAMKTLLASEKFVNTTMDLPIALGKTISNENFVADLAKMPHLLMAGATGQGKSVGLNAILVSLLYKKHPSQIKFVLVDPKKVELTLFNKIERHFLAKLPGGEDAIITDVKKVVYTLNSLCILMDQRYELLKMAMVRNLKEYNAKFLSRKLNPKLGHHYMPYIVLVVDEFADLIMTAGKEVELPIARLAQLARAIGIHLIIATQRPSVNIITGTIKANFPARIAFRVTSKIDSRTILDSGGADQLIGRGDMLFSTGSDLIRLQCPFVDTPEVDKITEFIGSQRGYASAFELPEYIDENAPPEDDDFDIGDRDAMFEEAAHIIVMHQQGSASLLQRKLKLGYNRAGRIVDQLEKAGIIGPFEGSKARKVIIKDAVTLEQFLKSGNQEV